MKVEYRIISRGNDYYPQVRSRGLLFWSKWCKIVKQCDNFALYGLPDWNYPKKSFEECEEIIKDYHEWLTNKTFIRSYYINIS